MSQRTLKEVFDECRTEFQDIQHSPERRDAESFQSRLGKVIQQWIELKSSITRRGIFSTNESIEDVNTTEIKYLSTDYYLAQLYCELNAPSKTMNLKKSILCYIHFLTNLDNYGLLDKRQQEKYEKVKETPFSMIDEGPAMARRDEKIANFKMERQLTTKLQQLERLENDDNKFHNADDEEVRSLYLDQLKLFTIKAFDSIRMLNQEMEMLANMPEMPKIQEVDEREKQREDPTKFTEKLEFKNEEVLSKEGKIMRPFTLVKREDLKKKVFGTGQYLPTVTVEEFLEQELANGGMITGGGNDGPDESSDEDDEERADRETYKARQWDDFTEANAKGSGNTMNRG